MTKYAVTVERVTTDVCEQTFEVDAETPDEAASSAEQLAHEAGGGWSKPQIVEGIHEVVHIEEVK